MQDSARPYSPTVVLSTAQQQSRTIQPSSDSNKSLKLGAGCTALSNTHTCDLMLPGSHLPAHPHVCFCSLCQGHPSPYRTTPDQSQLIANHQVPLTPRVPPTPNPSQDASPLVSIALDLYLACTLMTVSSPLNWHHQAPPYCKLAEADPAPHLPCCTAHSPFPLGIPGANSCIPAALSPCWLR